MRINLTDYICILVRITCPLGDDGAVLWRYTVEYSQPRFTTVHIPTLRAVSRNALIGFCSTSNATIWLCSASCKHAFVSYLWKRKLHAYVSGTVRVMNMFASLDLLRSDQVDVLRA